MTATHRAAVPWGARTLLVVFGLLAVPAGVMALQGAATGFVEVCKAAESPTVTGTFRFTVGTAAVDVPTGACSGLIRVPAGTVTITEAERPGIVVAGIDAVPASHVVSSDLAGRTAQVQVVAGDESTQTVVTFTNRSALAILKVCKVAGDGVAVGTEVSFAAGTQPVSVPAGPPPGGTCTIAGWFPVASKVPVTETVPFGTEVSAITVAPSDRLVGTPNVAGGSVVVKIGLGYTEVTFTNRVQTPSETTSTTTAGATTTTAPAAATTTTAPGAATSTTAPGAATSTTAPSGGATTTTRSSGVVPTTIVSAQTTTTGGSPVSTSTTVGSAAVTTSTSPGNVTIPCVQMTSTTAPGGGPATTVPSGGSPTSTALSAVCVPVAPGLVPAAITAVRPGPGFQTAPGPGNRLAITGRGTGRLAFLGCMAVLLGVALVRPDAVPGLASLSQRSWSARMAGQWPPHRLRLCQGSADADDSPPASPDDLDGDDPFPALSFVPRIEPEAAHEGG